jgi:hypothetical protein
MTFDDALTASRPLGQAVNRSDICTIMIMENEDELFQLNRQARWYRVKVMKDLTERQVL